MLRCTEQQSRYYRGASITIVGATLWQRQLVRKTALRGERKNLITGLLFVSPWIIGFVLWTAYPVLSSIYYSFFRYDLIRGGLLGLGAISGCSPRCGSGKWSATPSSMGLSVPLASSRL
jgi:hypothetical protein